MLLFSLLFLLLLLFLSFGRLLFFLAAGQGFQLLVHVNPREQGLALLHLGAGRQQAEGLQAVPGLQAFIRNTQLGEDAGGRRGHEGSDQHSSKPYAFRQGQHHVRQPVLLLRILAQHPGLGQVNILVALTDHLPDLGQGLGELQLIHLFVHQFRQGGTVLLQGGIQFSVHCVCPGGQDAVKILLDHRHGPADQVAQVVRQVRIHTGQEGFIGVVPVRSEGHFPHQVIAERIHAVTGHNGAGIDHIAL